MPPSPAAPAIGPISDLSWVNEQVALLPLVSRVIAAPSALISLSYLRPLASAAISTEARDAAPKDSDDRGGPEAGGAVQGGIVYGEVAKT